MATGNIEKIKKFFYSGVGFASHTSEIIKGAVDEFVKTGKLSEKDGQKIVEDAIGKIEARYNEAAGKVSEYASDEIGMLRKTIESLEKKVAAKSPAAGRALKSVTSRPAVKNALSRVEARVKKAAPKKAAAKKAASKGAPAKKAAVKKPASGNPAGKKAAAKKAVSKKAPSKKAASKKS